MNLRDQQLKNNKATIRKIFKNAFGRPTMFHWNKDEHVWCILLVTNTPEFRAHSSSSRWRFRIVPQAQFCPTTPFPFWSSSLCEGERRESQRPQQHQAAQRREPAPRSWTGWGIQEERHRGVEGQVAPRYLAPEGSALLQSIWAPSFPVSETQRQATSPTRLRVLRPRTRRLGKGNPSSRAGTEGQSPEDQK